ncbi:hypothetical protein [Neisseria dumasiana]|uniref:Uncharacterized protein n=1 Tax=Neisseria dumasiana TaxID=1931275 RepID=A0A1X3DL10_9NEIS|nr:hypothetical protein [Neisseria dumasiana]OSI24664.1 hypothetical protein BV912_02080 [Neisseria dumasiana]
MNYIDATITKIIEPLRREEYKGEAWWQMKVEIDSYGRKSETVICNREKSEVEKYKVGDVIQV